MRVVGIIQARMGSTRLPGKVMLPLDCIPVIQHDVRRARAAKSLDEVVVATTEQGRDEIVERYGTRAGATVYRGNEDDVLGRICRAAEQANADVVVRITGDCPLLSPRCVDAVVDTLVRTNAEYASNILDRTFPRGLDVEAFTFESFTDVDRSTTDPDHREHVTRYYLEHRDSLDVRNVSSEQVFESERLHGRTDLRLTLDEADDYELLRTVYDSLSYDGVLPIGDAIRYIDENDLGRLNRDVEQKT